MGDVVNLNQFRKQRSRGASQKRAAENRVKYGRGKDDKTRLTVETDRTSRELDGKHIDKLHNEQADKPASPEDTPKAR